MSNAESVGRAAQLWDQKLLAEENKRKAQCAGVRVRAEGEKIPADHYCVPAVCSNCHATGQMLVKRGVLITGIHNADHAKICPACGCRSFKIPRLQPGQRRTIITE